MTDRTSSGRLPKAGILVTSATVSIVALVGMGIPVMMGTAPPTVAGSGSLWAAQLPPAATKPATQAELHQLVDACAAAGVDDIVQLKELAASADPAVAGNALFALGRLGAVHDDTDLTALLRDSRPRVRHEVLVALGSSGDPGAAPLLETALFGEDRTAHLLAVQGLVQLGATRALDKLVADRRADEQTRRIARAQGPVATPRILASTSGLVGQ